MLPRSIPPAAAAMLTVLAASSLSAQTIRGRLLDLETDQPIDLALVIMLTEAGDSVTSSLTNPDGLFAIRSPEPGSFLLLGSAFGYRETAAGVFELGEGAEMTVEFRLRPEPVALDGLLVGTEALVFDHHLVRSGFVRRLQRGLGHFITPYDIQNSPARDTESLFESVPGIQIRMPRLPSGLPLTQLPDQVLMRSQSGLCAPAIYVDGAQVQYDPLSDAAESISAMVPLASIEAVEVYRRPAEVPVEYGVTQGSSRPPSRDDPTSLATGGCGVLVFWTKLGPRSGQPSPRRGGSALDPTVTGERPSLPSTDEQGPPPSAGERIRMTLDPKVAASLRLGPVWEATFLNIREDELVATDRRSGRPVAVPLQGVEMLQVERERAFRYAVRRGLIAGSVFGVGSWLALRVLCGEACRRKDEAALPAALIGVFGGLLVGSQGPGTHWVEAPLSEVGGGSGPP